MSGSFEQVRSEYVQKLAEMLVSVQPMTGNVLRDHFKIEFTTSSGSAPEHRSGDGAFCECFGRCYVCHPLTDEEKARKP